MRFIYLQIKGFIQRVFPLLVVAVVGFAFYSAYVIFPFYFSFWEIEGLMQSQAEIAQTKTDQEIREFIEEKIKKYEIPVYDVINDLKIQRTYNSITIDLEYLQTYEFDLFVEKPIEIHTFYFRAHAEAPLS